MTDAFAVERVHLKSVTDKIEQMQAQAEEEAGKAFDELSYARKADPDSLDAREALYDMSLGFLKRLRLSRPKPYFTRLDFAERGQSASSYYIGKYGVIDPSSLESVVVDWRAPIANLYYSGQLGHVSYQAPDGKIEGELTLKRQFDIADGNLLHIFDENIASQDAFLLRALNQMSGERLKDIVSTIQSEQNLVIRQPLKDDLIVQGAAGSGKTTIALHRIAYLLYAYSDRLRPERMLIIAPNPLFLDYISAVLPDLGVENAVQSTFEKFFLDFLGLKLRINDRREQLDRLMKKGRQAAEELNTISRIKGSRAFYEAFDAYLGVYERSLAPQKDLYFGPALLWKKEDAARFLLTDEAPFSFQRRVAQFSIQLKKRTMAAANDIVKWFKRESEKRAEKLRQSYAGSEELNAKLTKLYENRDARIKETLAQAESYAGGVVKSLPSLKPMEVYLAFLKKLSAQNEDPALQHAAQYSLGSIKTGRVDPEDIPPLVIAALRCEDRPKQVFRHIVIDEAQDLSPMQILTFKKCIPEASFTLVGDLMQGIGAVKGISDWSELIDNILNEGCKLTRLTTSYRSTRQIMAEAFKAARAFQDGDKIRVIRDGEACEYLRAADERKRISVIRSLLSQAKDRPHATVAVIEKDSKRAQTLFGELNDIEGIRLLIASSDKFDGSLFVCSASDAKGLEFDEVIIADASSSLYEDRQDDARLLYVALTRALHRLKLVYTGELTRLLAENEI